jgi:glucose/arabinose dehydrogenase/mono/diheme cytochrome c family protein
MKTRSIRHQTAARTLALAALAATLPMAIGAGGAQAQATIAAPMTATAGCRNDTSGLILPAGFCAHIFADDIGHARDLVVAPNGVVYVNTWSGRYYAGRAQHEGAFLVALQDSKGTGEADVQRRFGETRDSGGAGGSGIAYYHGYIYAESNDRIVRYALGPDSIVPSASAEVVISGLPLGGDHPMHPFAIDEAGMLYVDVASATNACQQKNRTQQSPGLRPCQELETRGGVWRYDAKASNQVFSPKQRCATGLRNAEGIAFDRAHRIFVTQHGRDQLYNNWPQLYAPEQEATLPAEEVVRLRQGGDFGWPECYFDPGQNKLVLAPEYGGNGGKAVGICAQKIAPVADFPAHWAPNDLLFYDGNAFPARYRDGFFIAFHGSWDRAPFRQGGYNVVFQPLKDGKSAGRCEIFADGFAGLIKTPQKAEHRPSGLAVGPDGALYISDDVTGRIYRVTYQSGGAADAAATGAACPDADAPAGPIMARAASPPEGIHPDAGKSAQAAVPPGATAAMVQLGQQIFSGQVGGTGCSECHGDDGGGTPLGPPLKAHQWIWSDGSYEGIQRTIDQGVADPRQYRSPMPAKGGGQLSEQQVSAVAAYVWGLGR